MMVNGGFGFDNGFENLAEVAPRLRLFPSGICEYLRGWRSTVSQEQSACSTCRLQTNHLLIVLLTLSLCNDVFSQWTINTFEPFFVCYGEIFATQKDKIKVVAEEGVHGFCFPGEKEVNCRI